MNWEEIFKSWGSPPGETEQQKMDNAEAAIKKAIQNNARLAAMEISVITQGSYKNKTNVRQDSDVDICICLNSTFFPRYPAGKTKEDYGNIDGTITHREFRGIVHGALASYFGSDKITPGDKAFHIHSNTYRVDADVLPAFAYKFYYGDTRHHHIDPLGVAFNTNNGNHIINWPHHAYENGKSKQDRTGQRYRKVVRIIKRLRNKMQDEKIAEAKDIASALIENLVWNVPDEGFNHDTYTADVRYVLANSFNETQSNGSYASTLESNGYKLLFGADQPWTRERANTFLGKAWDYIGFK